MMHPVGPQSAQTYWVRRALVGLVALALVVGVTWWLVQRGNSTDSAQTATTQTSSQAPELTGVLSADPSTVADGLAGDGLAGADGSDVAGLGADGAEGAGTAGDGTGTGASGTAAGANGAGDGGADGSSGQPGTGGTGAGDALAPATAPTTPPAAGTAAGTPAAGTAASGTKQPAASATGAATSPAGGEISVVQTTAAQVTVTVTKQVPMTTAPKTTPPPPPSYDASGMLICPDSAIAITATTLASSLFVSAQPRLGMIVTNTGSQKCVRDVSGALQTYTVYRADGTRVWSTADCFPGVGHESRVLAPKASVSFVIKWSATSSTAKTCTPRAAVKAGDYKLVAQLGALKSKPLPFALR